MRLLIAAGAGLIALMAVPFLMSNSNAQEGEAKYVGSDACKKCHFKEHRYWKKTAKVDTLAALRPTAESEAELFAKKKDAGLDPAKDYTGDAACLPCHTTGYGKEGGYPADAAKAAEFAESFGQVGCEACHGAGSKYVEHKTAELAANKDAKFTFDGLKDMGLVKPNAEVCAGCHNDKNPVKAEPFDFEKKKGAVHSKQ